MMRAARSQTSAPALALLWLGVAAVLAVLLLLVAPGRGASWGEDDQLFLTMSWEAANGFGLNHQLAQAPAYLLNALLMKAGLHEVLYFRYANYIISLASAALFFLGLEKDRWKSPVVPLAVCASLLISLNSVENPNSLALAFFLAGAGCFFLANDRQTGPAQTLLTLLAGLLLAGAGFMHAAAFIAMALVVGLMCLLQPPPRPHLLWMTFLAASLLLWGGYLVALGPGYFFAGPAGHNSSGRYLVFRTGLITDFYAEALVAFLAVAALAGRARLAGAFLWLAGAVTLFYGACLLAYVFQAPTPPPFPLHGVFLFSSEGQWISRVMGGFSFFLMLFAGFRWLLQNPAFALWQPLRSLSPTTIAAPVWQTLRQDSRARSWTAALFGLILLQAGLAAGSDTSISQGMVFLAGPAIGLAMVIWWRLDLTGFEQRYILVPLCALWLASCGLFALTYNHASNEPIFGPGRVTLNFTNLHGIKETPLYQQSTARLLTLYRTQDCAGKPFLTLVYLPGLYYTFQHPSPPDIGVIRPAMGFPEDKLRAILDKRKGWCVLDASEKEIDLDTAKHGSDPRAALRQWLIANSPGRYDIAPPPGGLSEIHFYVRQPDKS